MLDTRTPVRYAAISLTVGAGVGALLMWRLYAPGLAAGAAVGSWLYLSLLWSGLRKRLGALFGPPDLHYVMRLMVGCAVAAAAGLVIESLLAPPAGTAAGGLTRLLVTAGTLACFGVVYLALGWALRAIPAGGLAVWKDRAS